MSSASKPWVISIYFFLISPIKASFSRSKHIVQSCFKLINVVLGTPLKWSASRSLHFYVLRSPVCKMYPVWVQNSGKNYQKDPKRQTLHSLKTNIGIPVGRYTYQVLHMFPKPWPSAVVQLIKQPSRFLVLVAAALLPSSKAFHHFGTVPKGSREDAGSTHEWQVL